MSRLPLPIHGFVLAGGKSSRMGMDKALVEFGGRPMVEIAVAKLRHFCAAVSIAGNRDDLSGYAPVAYETRVDSGPAAGIEAGVLACSQEWAMFIPVDVPLVPAELLRTWAEEMLQDCVEVPRYRTSYLLTPEGRQPAFCIVHRGFLPVITKRLDRGVTRLSEILGSVGEDGSEGLLWPADVVELAGDVSATKLKLENWFSNVNTPQELALVEALEHPMRNLNER